MELEYEFDFLLVRQLFLDCFGIVGGIILGLLVEAVVRFVFWMAKFSVSEALVRLYFVF